MATSHTIRTKDGSTVTIDNYGRTTAIKAFCSECFGWEGHPKNECTSPLCPLYPYRGQIRPNSMGLHQKSNLDGLRAYREGRQHRIRAEQEASESTNAPLDQ